jgi:hypothetical protein
MSFKLTGTVIPLPPLIRWFFLSLSHFFLKVFYHAPRSYKWNVPPFFSTCLKITGFEDEEKNGVSRFNIACKWSIIFSQQLASL